MDADKLEIFLWLLLLGIASYWHGNKVDNTKTCNATLNIMGFQQQFFFVFMDYIE